MGLARLRNIARRGHRQRRENRGDARCKGETMADIYNGSSVSSSGLSQDQLAALFEQQQNGGGFNFPAGMQPSNEHNFPQATSLYGSQRTGAMPYGNNDMMQMQGMQSSMVPVRRLADRIGGEATASAANYSSMQLSMPQVPTQVMPQTPNRSWPEMPQMPSAGPQYLPMRTPEMPYYAQQISEVPVAMPADYAPVMVENRPAEMMLGGGYVPCDVLPRKAATIHDIWSGSNFCEEVAEMLQATGNGNYFSLGVGEPKMHPMNRGGLRERDMANKAGIGIALQRDDYSGIIHVKRIAPEGSAAADGRLRVSDVILAVDGISTASIGQELTSLIIGPEGTFVELIVEHSSGQEETIRIRRGAPQQLDDALNLPYHYYKTDDELPYYLSATDKEVAKSEVSSRIAEMRKRILSRPDVPSSSILSLDLMDHGAMGSASNYGVAQRQAQAMPPTQSPAARLPVTSPRVTVSASPRVLAISPQMSPAPPVQKEELLAHTEDAKAPDASSKKKKKR
mmetsp:Transcript_64679/g.104653  ORF Transcript_64679/g.104653 Transcript_64679/m.104653 type:complete len:510 (-) Transcript_64679:252-1781(-)